MQFENWIIQDYIADIYVYILASVENKIIDRISTILPVNYLISHAMNPYRNLSLYPVNAIFSIVGEILEYFCGESFNVRRCLSVFS